MRWYKIFLPDDDNDSDQRPGQQGQQQENDDHDVNQSNGTQPQQQGVEENDDDDNNYANVRGLGSQQNDEDDYDDYNNASQQGQPQDDEDDDDDDDDDDDQGVEASQQQDDDKDAANIRKGLHQADDDDNDQGQPKAQDENNNEDRPKPPKSSSVNINVSGNFDLHLEDSDLHEGGIMFSKKLLVQLFTGPGEHDSGELEVPVHQVQHEHLETADSGEWTIVELKAQDRKGATTYLKAKLDSGSDDNFMSVDIYKVTGLDFTEGPEDVPSYTMGDRQESRFKGTVELEYTAGIPPQKFIETFQVLAGLPHDVVFGKPLMTAAHMIMVNPNIGKTTKHGSVCLMEHMPKSKDSKAVADALQKQRVAEQAAAYEAKLKAPEILCYEYKYE